VYINCNIRIVKLQSKRRWKKRKGKSPGGNKKHNFIAATQTAANLGKEKKTKGIVSSSLNRNSIA
jgi:hypothetical protein